MFQKKTKVGGRNAYVRSFKYNLGRAHCGALAHMPT